jgi:hypothetical protein
MYALTPKVYALTPKMYGLNAKNVDISRVLSHSKNIKIKKYNVKYIKLLQKGLLARRYRILLKTCNVFFALSEKTLCRRYSSATSTNA